MPSDNTTDVPDNHPQSKLDPNFTYNGAVLPEVYCSDYIVELARDNTKRIELADGGEMDFLNVQSVNYIFTVCVRLRLPPEVRFRAALLFDKYMYKQMKSLWEFVGNLDASETKKNQTWLKIEANVMRQIPLRIVTAIQIASKADKYHTSLSLRNALSCLKTLGSAYTKQAILHSEVRMLKSVGYRITEGPLIYPESALKSLTFNNYNIDYNLCWQHIVMFMDIVFLHHDQVYGHLLKMVFGDRVLPDIDIARVKVDWMLLGNAVVVASIDCVHNEILAETIVAHLTNLTGTPRQDITDFAHCLKDITVMLHDAGQKKRKR